MIKHKKVFTLLSLALMMAMLFTVFAPVAAAPKEKVRVWVEFAPGKKGNVDQLLRGNGAQFHYTFDDLNSFVVTLPAAALNGISNNPNVVDIEEDPKRYLMAPQFDVEALVSAVSDLSTAQVIPWGVSAVQAPEAWSTTTGAGVKVCIIDTGYYLGHEDLPTNVEGYSQVDNEWFTDGNGHGSHVAGTIAGVDNEIGVVGVAPGVDLFIVKIFDNSGAWTTASDLAAAANTCVSNGADVISMSLGGGYSRKEERAFNTIYANGVLPIAAASNDGTSAYSYPASYSSVVSVAAIDESLNWADFSNFNDAVEVAAPGVDVLSTVPYIESRSLVVDGVNYSAQHVEYSAYTTVSGQVVDGGLCTATGSWSGKVVMCERGEISFYDKVMNVQNSGGVAAVIYNNVPGEELYATLGDEASSSAIVALGITQEDGQYIVANKLGTIATVSADYDWPANGYESYQGTSMATPHASAVAALVWSACPNASNAEIRQALGASAMDLGAPGRDVYYGYGLVQAADAIAYLGCGGTPVNNPPSVSIDSPSDGASFTEGDSISFSASASDVEDGNLSSAISWVSSIDGSLGTGASVSAVLNVGTHTITASVVDSEGASDSDSITVTVNPVGGGGDLVVVVNTDKASYGDREKVYVTTLVTADGAAVSGAAVSSTITFPNNTTATYSGVTGSDGTFIFNYRLNVRKSGSGTATVVSTASAAGFSDGSGSTTFFIQ